MSAFPVVEDFDVFEQRRLGLGTGAELRSMENSQKAEAITPALERHAVG